MSVRLQVVHVPDCPNLSPMLERLREATDLPVSTREVSSEVEAATAGMAGSPTLLINGRDPFAVSGEIGCSWSCRIYRDENGGMVSAPSVAQLRDALTAAHAAGSRPSPIGLAAAWPPVQGAVAEDRRADDQVPGEVLSAWRTRAQPLRQVERAVHQAILRAFAVLGRPPTLHDLDAVTVGSGRGTVEILADLHGADAIRLGADGQVVVAYPFSATPTRHRVRILDPADDVPSDGVDLWAMCAIDALGVSPMLGRDTRIDSVDVTSGMPVTVTMTAGRASWDPSDAVVFLGADGAGGPSADCCCDYLNFFTDPTAATTWAVAHPQVPGQILTQVEAEDLAARLFGPLLLPGEHHGCEEPFT